jgi:hypothetical protein
VLPDGLPLPQGLGQPALLPRLHKVSAHLTIDYFGMK